MATLTILGIMSGTSADGIDLALCEVHDAGSPTWGQLVHFAAVPYERALRTRIVHFRQAGSASFAEVAQLTRDISLAHAAAVRTVLHRVHAPLDAIADHGQTLFHAPPLTTQLLDPSLLSAETGQTVVSDFRRADCAVGGQGAPLVPFADQRLFSHPTQTRVLLNLGGIANITHLPATTPPASPSLPHCPTAPLPSPKAFDTGPANCISDRLCTHASDGKSDFDVHGNLAEMGEVNFDIVERFLAAPYFSRPAPKSTDGPEMLQAFRAAGGSVLPLNDALATAAECVARSVSDAIHGLSPVPDEVIASGGGTHNRAVMRRLAAHLRVPIRTTDDHGIPSPAKEAIAFALLAHATLSHHASNVPSCTGASRPVVLGSVTRTTPGK
jgi:anhydro-N-acetylmuramic acid kinase